MNESLSWPATKWMALVASLWVESFAGSSYAYPNYSSTLKAMLGYSQLQLNNLAVARSLGENAGFIAGLVCNKLPPWVILLIGALQGLLGYGLIWMVASGQITSIAFWQICAVLIIAGNSITWYHTASLVTCLRNFPNGRGTVVGFLKGGAAISGAIFTQIFIGFLGKDPATLLLFLSIGPLLVCLVAMGFVRRVQPSITDRGLGKEKANFGFIYAIFISLAVYLLGATIVDSIIENSLALMIIAGFTSLFLIAPLYVPISMLCSAKEEEEEEDPFARFLLDPEEATQNEESTSEVDTRVKGNLLMRKLSSLYGRKAFQEEIEKMDMETMVAIAEMDMPVKKKRPRRGEDFKLREALVKADFWLLFLAYFIGVGTGATVINNLAQIAQSQGYRGVSTFVSLMCIWNFVGRLGGGTLAEYFVRSGLVPRTVWMASSQLLMIPALLLIAFAVPNSLYFSSAVAGICYGVQVTVMVPTASELFGLKHFGMIYNTLTIAEPLASLLFSGLIAGYIYDYEAAKGSSSVCYGVDCYKVTFLIMVGMCVIGVGLASILSIRIIPVYKTLYQDPSGQSVTRSREENAH